MISWPRASRGIFVVLTLQGCAQRIDEIDERLESIDERTAILESKSGLPVGSDRELMERRKIADVRSQVQAIRNDYTVMIGKIEALQHDVKRFRARLDSSQRDFGRRLRTLEQQKATSRLVSSGGADSDYQLALRAHQNGEYRNARQLFGAFLIKYPRHAFSDNALYWMGEGYLAQKSYRRAITRFQELIEKFPRSDKRCDAIGRQIRALKALKMKKEAKAFGQVYAAECSKKKRKRRR